MDGNKFSDDDIATFVRMLLLAAAETTSRSFANMLVLLFQYPEELEKVKANRKLISKAITETMRLDPVAGNLARIAAKDMEVAGTIILSVSAVATTTRL